ncbi:uncharacterized protein LOC115217916 [Octopus sinensis]|uniref:Uncharacterized protein LOC115217916 n=1 Tax=Octopus sinensis TaxID=2607531 RepID=A0A6P7SZB3_9MOLL|nr:uncharacterized protein LOC115217916 [Octopus sinensis]
MVLLSCWSVLVFTLAHFTNIQATRWDVTVCFAQAYYSSVHCNLNYEYKEISYKGYKNCFYTNFELNGGEEPSSFKVNLKYKYKAYVQNHDIPEMYFLRCSSSCSKKQKLEKWTQWNLEVISSEINDNYNYSFEIKPSGVKNINFGMNSKTSNKSFFLPREMNTRSRIEIETTGKFWSETVVSKPFIFSHLETRITGSLDFKVLLVFRFSGFD